RFSSCFSRMVFRIVLPGRIAYLLASRRHAQREVGSPARRPAVSYRRPARTARTIVARNGRIDEHRSGEPGSARVTAGPVVLLVVRGGSGVVLPVVGAEAPGCPGASDCFAVRRCGQPPKSCVAVTPSAPASGAPMATPTPITF